MNNDFRDFGIICHLLRFYWCKFIFFRPYASGQGTAAKYEQNVELVTTNRWRPAQLVMNRFQDEKKNPYWHHGGGQISWFIFEDLTKVVPIFLLLFKLFYTFDVYLGMAWTIVRKRQTSI